MNGVLYDDIDDLDQNQVDVIYPPVIKKNTVKSFGRRLNSIGISSNGSLKEMEEEKKIISLPSTTSPNRIRVIESFKSL